MDFLTLLLLIVVLVLAIMVVQLKKKGCQCPVDQQWLDEFNKWAAATDKWAMQVQSWLDAATPCINAKCFPNAEGVTTPQPPPCKFGDC